MAKHTFVCRSCGVALSAAQEAVGKLVRCPSCNGKIRVPSLAEEAAYQEEQQRREEAEAEAARQQDEATRARKKTEAEEARHQKEAEEEYETAEQKKTRQEYARVRQAAGAGYQRPTSPMERAQELARHAAAGYQYPASPMAATTFLNVMAVVLIVAGAIALIAGLVACANTDNDVLKFVCIVGGVGACLQMLWAAALTYAFASLAQNVFGMHKKLEAVATAKPPKDSQPT